MPEVLDASATTSPRVTSGAAPAELVFSGFDSVSSLNGLESKVLVSTSTGELHGVNKPASQLASQQLCWSCNCGNPVPRITS